MDVGLDRRITLRKPVSYSRGRFSATAHLKVASTFDGEGMPMHSRVQATECCCSGSEPPSATFTQRLLIVGQVLMRRVLLLPASLCCCLGVGVPEFGADLDNVKPPGLIVAAAVAMLAVGLPLSGGKTFSNVHTQLPSLTSDALAMVSRTHPICCKAAVLHTGCWLLVVRDLPAWVLSLLAWQQVLARHHVYGC